MAPYEKTSSSFWYRPMLGALVEGLGTKFVYSSLPLAIVYILLPLILRLIELPMKKYINNVKLYHNKEYKQHYNVNNNNVVYGTTMGGIYGYLSENCASLECESQKLLLTNNS